MNIYKDKPKISKSLIKSANLFPVVGIGASAGGLDAFKKLLKSIPENSGMAFVLVQHLDPNHESLLPELLQKVTNIPVQEITDDIKVEPNHIYIIPANKMMLANDGKLELINRIAPENNKRILPIDLFFTSLAEVHQSHSIGVVLSGTANDGTLGLKAIKDHGGITFAQDEKSAAYAGMPRSAAQAGVVDFILPPNEIPQKVLEITKITTGNDGGNEQNFQQGDEDVFKLILSLLRIRKGTDFTYYKQTTIRRRILRRMALNRNEELSAYLKFFRENKPEQDILFLDLLIPVTAFFRDSKSFDNLRDTVFPRLLENRTDGEPIRIWVAGCSTGEEAYSIAMCFKEFLGNRDEKLQIFATDISETAIAKARTGIYVKNDLEGISPQRLEVFFTKSYGGYQVNKELRDMCVFAIHNFLKDPPFGKIDFISCRNVLIYMEPYLQKKALTTFHYSLNSGGFLLLGKSETTSNVPDLFAVAAKNDKLFSRKNEQGGFMQMATLRSEQNFRNIDASPKSENIRTDFQKTADDIMLSKYTPAGVVVNEAMDIVHFRGNTGSYLEQAPGKPSHNLLKLAKSGLAFELRNILLKAKEENTPVIKENVPLQVDGNLRTIHIEAIPLSGTIEPYYLVLFHDPLTVVISYEQKKKTSAKTQKDKDLRIEQLEKELSQTYEDMRTITNDQESASEQLQSTNEELLSGSEELKSLNEELETSKEELQSTNEELLVVNQELVSSNEQVKESRDYAEAIITNLRQPLLVLDKNLRVKTANSAFYKSFQVTQKETEGNLVYDLGNQQWNFPGLRTLLEKILPEKTRIKDFEVSQHFPSIGLRFMLLNAYEIIRENNSENLILLAIEDITERNTAEEKIKESEKLFHFIADAMPQKVWTADARGNRNYFNKKLLDYTGHSIDELKEWGWKKMIHPNDWIENEIKWRHSIDTGSEYEFENRIANKDGEFLWHLSRALAFKDENEKIRMWIGSDTDIQVQKQQKEELGKAVVSKTSELRLANQSLAEKYSELEKMNKELESFNYVSSHDLQEPLRKIQIFTSRISEEVNHSLSDKGKYYAVQIQAAVARMRTLIQDLLEFSHISAAEKKFEETDLYKIVEEVKSELKESLEAKKATIDASPMCKANVIPFQFRQLFNNLISNALKFSIPGTPPHITIASRNIIGDPVNDENLIPGKEYCHITFTDNGIGFEPKFKDIIFEVFQKLHVRDEYEGTGIGLAIVKKIVGNHNGIISAVSELGKGVSIYIYFPAGLK